MKEDENKLDSLFRKKLEQSEAKSSDSDWQAMQKLLEETDSPKSKPGWMQWFKNNGTKMMLITLAGIALFFAFNFFVQNKSDQNQFANTNQATAEQHTNHQNKNLNTEKETDEKPTTVTNSNASINEKTDEVISSEKVENKSKQIETTNLKTVPTPKQIKIGEKDDGKNNSPANHAAEKIKSNITVSTKPSRANPKSVSDNSVDKSTVSSRKEKSKNNSNTNQQLQNADEIATGVTNDSSLQGDLNSSHPSNDAANQKSNLENKVASQNKNQIEKQSVSPENKNNVTASMDSTSAIATQKPTTAIQDSTVKSKKKSDVSFYLGADLAAAFVSKKLQPDNSVMAEYQTRRENEESKITTMHAGLTATLQLNNLMLSSGVGISKYGEQTNYKPESMVNTFDSVMVFTPDSFATLDTSQGQIDTVWIFFNDTSYTLDTVLANAYNASVAAHNGKTTWSYVEIPLMLWYRFDVNKITFDAGAGISIGFLQKVNSYYLNTTLTDIESIDEKKYYRKTILNLLIGARLNYKITNSFSLGLDLKYKSNLNSVFQNSYPVNQRYRAITTGVAVMYKF